MNKTYLPLVRLRPIKTFPSRFRWKLLLNRKLILNSLKIPAYSRIKFNSNEHRIVVLVHNKFKHTRALVPGYISSGYHPKLEPIFLVEDEGIYKSFKKKGAWELSESKLSSQIIRESNVKLIVDLGANQGLWAVQTLANLQSENFPALVTVEADPLLSALINLNLLSLGLDLGLVHHHYNMALVKENKPRFGSGEKLFKINFYSDIRSSGHQTIDSALVPELYRVEKKVAAIHARDFFSDLQDKFGEKSIFIKSDLQGADASILCQANQNFWKLVSGFQIEVWPIGKHSADIKKLLSNLGGKYNLFLKTENSISQVDIGEIATYWNSNTLINSTFGNYKTLWGIDKKIKFEIISK